MSKKFKLALILFILGFIGILAVLPEFIRNMAELTKDLSNPPSLLSNTLMFLAFPTISLLIAVTVGTMLYDKVNFKLPVLEGLVDRDTKINTSGVLPFGIIGGIIVGVLFTITLLVFNPILPAELIPATGNIKVTNLIGLLHEGLTWEIINRFGIMTFLVWVIYKISGKLNPAVYWTAIILMFVLFGLKSIFPLSSQAPTITILFYNTIRAIGVFVYGWLYWKKGLETAIIAHVFAYFTMMIGEMLFLI